MKLDGMDGLVMWAWRGYFSQGRFLLIFFSGKVQKKKKKTLEFYPRDK